MVDWVSLAIPVAYLGILVGSLATFSSLYRKRKVARAASLEPWFGPHLQRNIYLSLLHLEDSKVPDSVIKAALLRRATEDVNRILQMRSSRPALSTLLARGSVSDDLWQRFQRAEKELEAELQDVINEANALSPGWGQTIFQSASEIAANARLRQRVDEVQAAKTLEKEWWEKKRATTRAEFMKELDNDAENKEEAAGSRRGSLAPSSTAGDKTGSDEDAVLVEAGSGTAGSGSPTTPNTPNAPSQAEGGKKKKKKSNKKRAE